MHYEVTCDVFRYVCHSYSCSKHTYMQLVESKPLTYILLRVLSSEADARRLHPHPSSPRREQSSHWWFLVGTSVKCLCRDPREQDDLTRLCSPGGRHRKQLNMTAKLPWIPWRVWKRHGHQSQHWRQELPFPGSLVWPSTAPPGECWG